MSENSQSSTNHPVQFDAESSGLNADLEAIIRKQLGNNADSALAQYKKLIDDTKEGKRGEV